MFATARELVGGRRNLFAGAPIRYQMRTAENVPSMPYVIYRDGDITGIGTLRLPHHPGADRAGSHIGGASMPSRNHGRRELPL